MALTVADIGAKLDSFFVTMADKVAGDVVGKALPLLGKLGDLPGGADTLDPFAALKTDILNAVNSASGPDVAQAIADAINGLNLPGVHATKTPSDGVDITLGATKTVNTGSALLDIGGSVGSFLDLKVNTGATFTATLDATISFEADGTFALKEQANPELDIQIGTNFSIVELDADLGVAKVKFNDADPTEPELTVDFDLDLSLDTSGNFTITPTLTGSAGLNLNFETTDVLAGLLPDMKGQLIVDFATAGGAFATPTIAVANLKVDLGSYLGIVGETFGDLSDVFDATPLDTIVDVATAPVPVLNDLAETFRLMGLLDTVGSLTGGGDGIVTIGDLAAAQNPALKETIGVWYQAFDLIEKIKTIGEMANVGEIDFGGGTLVGGVTQMDPGRSVADIVADLKTELENLNLPTEVVDFLSDIDLSGLPGTGGGSGGGGAGPSKGFTFGLFENPEDILKILLTDQPVDLVKFDVPELAINQAYGGFFPVLGPLGFLLEGAVKAKLDIDIGYDTQGLIDGAFQNGFFVSTASAAGTPPTTSWDNPRGFDHLPVGALDTKLTGGAGVGFLGSSLTVNASFGFGLYAYFEAAGSDGKYRPGADGFDCIFEPIGGRADVSVNVTIKVGFGPFSVKKNIPLAEATLADFTIFECPPPLVVVTPEAPGLATIVVLDNTLRLNVGNPQHADQRKIADDHGHVSPVLQLADDAETPGVNESFNEAYVIGRARDAGDVVDGLDVFAFGFTQRVVTPTVITADFKDGNDRLVIQRDVLVESSVSGGKGNDTLFGGGAKDILLGDEDDDYLSGDAGDDVLSGGSGDDQLVGGTGGDWLDGGEGFDTVDYSNANKGTGVGVTVLIAAGGIGVSGHGGEAEGDTLIRIESLIGTEYNDDFRAGFGVSQSVIFDGGAGDDILIGGTGEDLLLGGAGADHLNGDTAIRSDATPGVDGTTYITSWGAVDVDFLRSVQRGGDAKGDRLFSIEAVEGSIYSDTLRGDGNRNLLYGSDGNDTLEGRGGQDTVSGDYGNDLIYGGADGDTLDGGAGIDTLSYEKVGGPVTVDLGGTQQAILGIVVDIPGSAPDKVAMAVAPAAGDRGRSTFENLIGTGLGDTLFGDIGDNRIEGRGGSDLINGDAGFDILVGGLGADQLIGGSGIDWVYYNDSSSRVIADLLATGADGTAQGDTYFGVENILGSTHAADILRGDDGDNIIDPNISGLTGTETVSGRLGTDTLRLNYSAWGVDIGQGVVGGYAVSPGPVTSGSFTRANGANNATLDTVNFDGIERFEITGTRRDDRIYTGDGSDVIVTGSGNDTVVSGLGSDIVLAGNGNDDVTYGTDSIRVLTDEGGSVPFYLDGGRGIDTLSVSLADIDADVTLVGSAPGVEFQGTNVSIPNGIGITNFEILRDVYTGGGADFLRQDGFHDNRFITGGRADEIMPGFGTDFVDAGEEEDGQYYDGMSPGDLLVLDYSSYTGPAGVVGSTNSLYQDDDFHSNEGTYRAGPAGDLNVDLTFTNIEVMSVVGSAFDDFLTGAYGDRRSFDEFEFSTPHGDDTLDGGDGNDTIIGYTGEDSIRGGAGDDILVGADPGQATPSYNFETSSLERDDLEGGEGADTFVLGTEGGLLYATRALLIGDQADWGRGGNRAVIEDFRPIGDGDTIQLYGSAAEYAIEEEDGITYLFHVPSEAQHAKDIVAQFYNFTGLDLNASYVKYVDSTHAGVALTPTTQGTVPPAALASSSATSEGPALRSAAPMALTAAAFSVAQEDDIAVLKAVLDGTSGGAGSSLTLAGSAEAFGTFAGDPFGLGSGIILSTGNVEDLPGENTVQSGGTNVTSIPITFVKIGRAGGSDIFRADLSNIGTDVRSITIADGGSGLGGAGGIASGFDLDALALSHTRLDSVTSTTNLNDFFTLEPLDLFDFGAGSLEFTPGTQRPPTGFPNGPTLDGAANVTLVDNSISTLGRFSFGADSGSLTLGDGGSLGLQLRETLPTSGPLYLYIGEEGATGETVVGSIEVSPDTLQPSGDLSTDLGAEGLEGDTTSLTYTFTPIAGDNSFSLDVALFSEELPEFIGTSLTDLFSIKLNGVEIGALSNGAELSIKNLVYGGSDDLILNPVGTGPLADTIRADAYTKTLRISGAVDTGVLNTLTIEMKDDRDAFLDSGILIKDGSFRTFKKPEVTITFDGGAGSGGGTGSGGSGTIAIGGGGTITVTPPAGATVPVTVVVDPGDGFEIGGSGGPGNPVTLIFNPGDPPVVLPIEPVAGANPGDTGTVTYEVISTDPDINGQDIAPDVFEVVLRPNQAPEITPSAGEILVGENATAVTTIVASDTNAGQTLTFSIEGGADQHLFEIDAATGALRFKTAPDFENPADAGQDNVYDVVVGVKDNGTPVMSDTQALTLRVTDTAETSTLVVKFVSEEAGYKNTVGWYDMRTGMGGILFEGIESNGKNRTVTPGVTTVSFDVATAAVPHIGYFLVPNGGAIGKNDGDLDGAMKVIQLPDGRWAVVPVDAAGNIQRDKFGKPDVLDGAGAYAVFTETSKNAGGVDYASSKAGVNQTAASLAGDTADGPTGLIAWEDIAAARNHNNSFGKPGDADYDDAVLLVSEVKGQTLVGDDTNNTLTGGIAPDLISGNGGNDTLNGGLGDDKLDGGLGLDRMIGGGGNDLYVVDNGGDVVDEGASGSSGNDTVQSSITFSLANTARVKGSVENLVLTGNAEIDATGNGLGNLLVGNSAANELNGLGGADVMQGLGGDDRYFVDNARDVVDESVAGSGGVDTVMSSVTFDLSDSSLARGAIENLTLSGNSGLKATGSAGANVLTGNSGANTLNGLAGNDTLQGNGGGDTFHFNTPLNAATNMDLIIDFETKDTIALENAVFSALKAGKLDSGAFYAAGSATAGHDSSDRIVYNTSTGALYYDADGNKAGGVAAIQFAVLQGSPTLSHSDFLVM